MKSKQITFTYKGSRKTVKIAQLSATIHNYSVEMPWEPAFIVFPKQTGGWVCNNEYIEDSFIQYIGYQIIVHFYIEDSIKSLN